MIPDWKPENSCLFNLATTRENHVPFWYMHPANPLFSLCTRAIWSEFSLFARRSASSLAIHRAFSEDSDHCANAQANLSLLWAQMSGIVSHITDYFFRYAGLDLNARRKNATRETTNTLKAWLYEHRKNPYPTKGEKIMLAIITKMTLTQVSTWFANARRRLKKENKMTWSPRNRSEDDDDDDNDDIEERHNNQGDSLNDLNISHSDLDISENRNGIQFLIIWASSAD